MMMNMWHKQERDLCCFKPLRFFLELSVLQQNLADLILPKIKNYSDPGFKLRSYDIKASPYYTTLQIFSLLIRNKTPRGCNFFRRKLSFPLLLSLT